MKNFDQTRRQLRERGWHRVDRTFEGRHIEIWRRVIGQFTESTSYQGACASERITPIFPKEKRKDPRKPNRRDKKFQVKYVNHDAVIEFVKTRGAALARERGVNSGGYSCYWVPTWDIVERFDYLPPSVVVACLRMLVRRGRLKGHACSIKQPWCRGDFELP